MNDQLMTAVPAHFDGQAIQLDVPLELPPNARLLVVILDPIAAREALVYGAMKSSEPSFARVWDNDEDAAYDALSSE
jgi:hypothetical protein